MTEDRLTNLSKILIEKELLSELINVQPFCNDIIYQFANLKQRRIDLDLVFKAGRTADTKIIHNIISGFVSDLYIAGFIKN